MNQVKAHEKEVQKAVKSIGARVTPEQYDFILSKAQKENLTISEWLLKSMFYYIELQKNVEVLYECVDFCMTSASVIKNDEVEIELKKTIDFLEPLK